MKTLLDDATIRMDKALAREQFLAYRHAVRARHSAEDAEIMRGYQALSQGKQIINLREVIGAGGCFPDGMPRLAVAQSDTDWVHCDRRPDGSLRFTPRDRWNTATNARKGITGFPAGTLAPCAQLGCDMSKTRYDKLHNPLVSHAKWDGNFRAMVPVVPAGLRPAPALSNYMTLFEVAEWAKAPRPPGDPALLKHVGGELYAVLAVWDLTPLEQAVLSGRNLRTT